MSDVTRLIESAQKGDRQAAAELFPRVYDELRKLAAAKMAAEVCQWRPASGPLSRPVVPSDVRTLFATNSLSYW